MNASPLNLIVETPSYDAKDFSIIKESDSSTGERRMYIEGPFTEADSRNQNRRIYPLQEMVQQINEFNQKYIVTKRAHGELEHPPYPQLNLEKACHLITSIKQDGKVFIGRSKVLSHTPKGAILDGLLRDDVQVGISSRSLGKIDPQTGIVSNFHLCTFDVVSDPSCQKAFVNGILESKSFICDINEMNERIYEEFEQKLNLSTHLKSREYDSYIREAVLSFIRSI